MSIHAALNHVTHYKYDRPVTLGPQVVRLRPAPHCRSNIISYSLKIEPVGHFVNWQQDPFANYQARLVFPEKATEFKVTVDLVAEMAVYNPFDFFLEPDAEEFPFTYAPELKQELAPYLITEPATPLVQAYLDKIDRTKRRSVIFLVDLNQMVHKDINYTIRMEPGVQTPEETLTLGSGSCRDSGWLLVQLLRHCGLAARFVSGYLIQLAPDVKSLDGPSGTEVDFTDLHAWCEVYLPGAGWVGLDATSGLLAGEGHIPLACTPTPSSAAPIEGGVDECEVEFAHHMQVTRIYESPRVTLPYTDEQWADVMALGAKVDQELVAGDVRLTMGGEPTFVAVNDRDAPNGTPTPWARPSAAWPASWCTSCATNTARAVSCTSARASGTPASSCRAGRCRSAGAPTASRSGTTPACLPTSASRMRTPRGFAALHPDAVTQARPVRPLHRTRLRGHLVLPVARAPPAGQRGPVRIEAGRRDGAHPPAPRLHPGAGHRRGLRAAAAVQPAGRPRPGRSAVDHRPLVPARRAHVPDARRFADGLPPAARFLALGSARPTTPT
jgi:transglutaminase-like putative cysteine protease